jgi:hypothetical protein
MALSTPENYVVQPAAVIGITDGHQVFPHASSPFKT